MKSYTDEIILEHCKLKNVSSLQILKLCPFGQSGRDSSREGQIVQIAGIDEIRCAETN